MKPSVMSRERLNWRRRPFSRLARMKSFTSGCDDVERAHLRAAAPARRGHGEAHLVVDIHERHRAGRIGAGARDKGAARAQGREFVADAAAGLERQACLVDFLQDSVHRILDRAGHRAVDRGRGRFVFERAGIGGDAAGRDRAAAQRPQEAFVPVFLLFRRAFGLGQRTGDALVGVIDVRIDRGALLGLEPVLFVPDVLGSGLHGDRRGRVAIQGLDTHGAHFFVVLPKCCNLPLLFHFL